MSARATIATSVPSPQLVESVVAHPSIDAMLAGLPTAHEAPPMGHRIAGQGCHGTRKSASVGQATSVRGPRVRFVYFHAATDAERKAGYHRHLVIAEILLGRVLAARAAGMRPIAPALDKAAEARATVRPPRELFHAATLEYRRWYDVDGAARSQPLTQEALAVQLVADGLSMQEARHRAVHHSHALSAAHQTWLIQRRNSPLACRMLNQSEFRLLAQSIDSVWQVSTKGSRVERVNRQIALRVAALLGSVLDEYVAPPFSNLELNQAFSDVHLAHLRQTIETSRQAESASGVLLAGPKAWFAAKAARMRAEHQIGLALSPVALHALQLVGRPVVTVLGGKLRTYVGGWSLARSDSHPAADTPKSASVG